MQAAHAGHFARWSPGVIVSYPHAPPVEGELRLPRPAVFLLGSYGYGTWVVRAARQLESGVGCVFHGPVAPRGDYGLLVEWTHQWLDAADIVGCWIDGIPWSQLEIGWAIGRGKNVIVGVPMMQPHVSHMFHALGVRTPIQIGWESWQATIRAQR
jgi:hypothetical protein